MLTLFNIKYKYCHEMIKRLKITFAASDKLKKANGKMITSVFEHVFLNVKINHTKIEKVSYCS